MNDRNDIEISNLDSVIPIELQAERERSNSSIERAYQEFHEWYRLQFPDEDRTLD